MLGKTFVVTIFGLGMAEISWSHYSTAVLPKGIHNPSFRSAQITGLDEKFDETGELQDASNFRMYELNSKNLSAIEPRVKDLVNALNAFGRYDLGSNIHMGGLKVIAHPEVQYNALIWAYGVSSQWTLGFGLPVINYKNKISISQSENNLDFYEAYAKNSGNSSLMNAIAELKAKSDIRQQFKQELENKGYKPLEDQNVSYLGDLQIASLYQFYADDLQSSLFRLNINLPTGPKYDADNLAALNQFGRSSLEPVLAYDRQVYGTWHLLPFVSYKYFLPDQVTMRVPTSEDDFLPQQKQNLGRQIGSILTTGIGSEVSLGMGFSTEASLEKVSKNADKFSSGSARSDELLARGTQSEAQVWSLGVGYSSVESYLKRKQGIPMRISYRYSDTFAGKNTERSKTQEVNLNLYF